MLVRQYNFFFLLAGLLLLLLGVPLFQDLTGGSGSLEVVELALSVFLISGIWSLREYRQGFFVAVVLVILAVGGGLMSMAGFGLVFAYLSLVAYSLFLSLTIVLATRQVFRSRTVNLNNIVGAICIYLLLGIIWSTFYTMVNVSVPGSFSESISGSVIEQSYTFIYFSLVTLTSLGYGDISPVADTARVLAALEAMFGQFYIAILVAGLVASYMQSSEAK